MNVWKSLRTLAFLVLALSPAVMLTGCGGGDPGPGTPLAPTEDPTLNPATDSTMAPP